MANESKRTYSESEVGALISRAIARQEADRQRQQHAEQGLTLEEVKRIAQEAGVDPAYITLAASDMERAPEEKTGGFFGAPLTHRRERLVPGHLTDEHMGKMLAEIRQSVTTSSTPRGHFEKIGRTFEWSTPTYGSARNLLIQGIPEDDHTRIAIREKHDGMAVAFHIWWMTLVPLAILFTFIPDIPSVVGIALFLLGLSTFFIGREAFKTYVRKKHAQIEGLLGRLEAIAADAGLATGTPTDDPLPAGELGGRLDASPEEEATKPSSTHRRQRA